jgi:hypothetical protein
MITTTCLILVMPLAPLDADVVLVDLVLDELLEQAATVMAATHPIAHPIAPMDNLRQARTWARYVPNRPV